MATDALSEVQFGSSPQAVAEDRNHWAKCSTCGMRLHRWAVHDHQSYKHGARPLAA